MTISVEIQYEHCEELQSTTLDQLNISVEPRKGANILCITIALSVGDHLAVGGEAISICKMLSESLALKAV